MMYSRYSDSDRQKDVTTPLTTEIAVLNGFLEGQDVLAKDGVG